MLSAALGHLHRIHPKTLVYAALEKAVVDAAVSDVISVGLQDLLASGAGDSLKEFLARNTPAMPARLHRNFNQRATKLWAKGGPLARQAGQHVLEVMQLIAPEVFHLIPADWLQLAP